MKVILFSFILFWILFCAYNATQECYDNSQCPPYQSCTDPPNQVCTYTNPCVCSSGLLTIITGDVCPLGLLCTIGSCLITPGHCKYDGNVS